MFAPVKTGEVEHRIGPHSCKYVDERLCLAIDVVKAYGLIPRSIRSRLLASEARDCHACTYELARKLSSQMSGNTAYDNVLHELPLACPWTEFAKLADDDHRVKLSLDLLQYMASDPQSNLALASRKPRTQSM